MSFLNNLAQFLPFGKKEEKIEYFFAVNIGVEKLTAALWCIEGKELKILEIASENYSSNTEIISVTDRLLDQVLGLKEIEPQKILFGVPDSWIIDENLKDQYLKLIRNLVKELELTPMAYVAVSHALIHFLEAEEGVPTTAILVGFEKLHLIVTVVRAGKLDGTKIITRGENCGSDIEKALLTFTDVETLPSKILIYGPDHAELKNQLVSFSWMLKLSFLHFPKIDVLGDNLEIKSICLAGASEINTNVSYADHPVKKQAEKIVLTKPHFEKITEDKDNFGFMVGDVSEESSVSEQQEELVAPQEHTLEVEDFEPQGFEVSKESHKKKLNLTRFIPKNFTQSVILLGLIAIAALFIGAYVFLLKADVKIFVEPRVLEKSTQVVADPNQKTVNEDGKIIPGQIVETEISGSGKDTATGRRQIGDPARGTVVIINNTSQGQNFPAGLSLSSGGIKFKLDNTASVSATLVDSDSKSKVTVTVTAVAIGADGNIPSETNLTIGNYPASQFVGKVQGNFSGGTSKDVTVVSSEDAERLMAKLSSDLRQQAEQKLQDKFPDKKILQEALSEQIISKSYNKNINDQASEFSLNMTIRYKGTAFLDKDLKLIVSKLVTTEVPDSFELDLSETETQADVSKLEKDGKLIFLSRFKAKLIPKINTDKIRSQIKFKTPAEVADYLKGLDNVLGSEINLTPNLPKALQRLPILSRNIKIEVGLK